MISIIIPTFNEEKYIGTTVKRLLHNKGINLVSEIIIVDGGSTDQTVKEAEATTAIVVRSTSKGRAVQMNEGAALAKSPVLYFLHADSIPPNGFAETINKYLCKGYDSGCFRLKFDHPHWFLKSIAWLTMFNTSLIRFGDQSLFIRRSLFQDIGGFASQYVVMEDHEIIDRIKKRGRFVVIPQAITTSARKFIENGLYRLMGIFLYIYLLYYLRFPQETLIKAYRKHIRNGKL